MASIVKSPEGGKAPVNDIELKSYHASLAAKKTLRHIVCIFLCFLSLFPFVILFINATRYTKDIEAGITLIPDAFFAKNFDSLMAIADGTGTPFWKCILNSFLIAAPTTIFSVYFSSMTAYGVHVYNFKLKKFAWSFILAIMMVPAQVSIIGFIRFMMDIGLADTYIPLVIPAIAAPSVVFFMRQYMQSSLSIEMIEAARIDGAGEFRIFNFIVFPLLKPALATQAIFQFIASWNNLFTPSMIISSQDKLTLPMFIQQLRSEQFRADYGMIYMGLFITVIPIFVVYFALAKHIIAGVALGGVKE